MFNWQLPVPTFLLPIIAKWASHHVGCQCSVVVVVVAAAAAAAAVVVVLLLLLLLLHGAAYSNHIISKYAKASSATIQLNMDRV